MDAISDHTALNLMFLFFVGIVWESFEKKERTMRL